MQFDLAFYLEYLAKWPEYCLVAEGPGRQVMGYIVGKVEGQGEHWHGHVTAVTVAPDFRCAETGKGLSTDCKPKVKFVSTTRCRLPSQAAMPAQVCGAYAHGPCCHAASSASQSSLRCILHGPLLAQAAGPGQELHGPAGGGD